MEAHRQPENRLKGFLRPAGGTSRARSRGKPHRIKAAAHRHRTRTTGHSVYANDNPVRFTDPFGLYSCDENSDPCEVAKNARDRIQKAQSQLPRNATTDRQRLQAALDFLGAPGEKNGVIVTFGDAGGNFAQTDTEDGSVTITLGLKNLSRELANKGASSLLPSATAGILAHEATHGINGLHNGGNPTNFFMEFATEHNAFEAGAAVNRGLGTYSIYGTWNPAWKNHVQLKRARGVSAISFIAAQRWCQSGGNC